MRALLNTVGKPSDRVMALLGWGKTANFPSGESKSRVAFLRTLCLGEHFDENACRVVLAKVASADRKEEKKAVASPDRERKATYQDMTIMVSPPETKSHPPAADTKDPSPAATS